MDIEVKDPITGALFHLEAHPENLEGQHGFRILHPNGSSFFVVNRSGAWRSGDDHHVDAGMLINIGIAIEGGALKDQVVHPAKF